MKQPKPRADRKPNATQKLAAKAIVAGIPPAQALQAAGYTSPPAEILKQPSMRQALKNAIERQLAKANKPPCIDTAISTTLVNGLDATRPVVVASQIEDYPDYATRGAYLDRMLKLTGDTNQATEDSGDSWDEMILRMRRPAPPR